MSIFSRLKKLGRDEDDAAAPPAKSPVPPPPPTPSAIANPKPSAVPTAAPSVVRNSNGRSNGQAAPVPPRASVAADKLPALSKTIAYSASPAAVARARQELDADDPFFAPPSERAPQLPVAMHEPVKGSIDMAIEMVLDAEPPPTVVVSHNGFTASDQAALHATFEDLAVPHMAEVRSVMMEVRWGEVQSSWLELARPALGSLRKMAEPVGHTALVQALDGFTGVLDEMLAAGQPSVLPQPARESLLAAYAPLCSCLPAAFELDGERDRREPLIVRALLEQIQGLEPLMIEKMLAAGLGKLSSLYAARPDEIAAVTGIPDTIAAATASRIQAFRRATPAGLATIDPVATLRELGKLLESLRSLHVSFEEAARGWSEKDWLSKKQLRRQRQLTFLQITIEVVRLGECDLAQRLPKMAFARRIDELEHLIGQAARSARASRKIDTRSTAATAS